MLSLTCNNRVGGNWAVDAVHERDGSCLLHALLQTQLQGTAVMLCVAAAKLRDEFTAFIQGAFALVPLEIPGSRFKRAKEAQRYINSVVSGENRNKTVDCQA